ncbi:MAG: hypothetical protein JF888_04340 [Candidatus Dormibacteraeota bacterium]|uniref:Uncharacterized protein n=1 Tax=Candidatus Dormiibacter inghamiae TaxID=3127013 RepID=A0A934K9F1_9BACT|nr:hypothetical protein [Candidatus Dormibacteraeota bacterium]MBJ7605017.1 hypothetical protein [Candidatus Dormibacteraeota bacterium]
MKTLSALDQITVAREGCASPRRVSSRRALPALLAALLLTACAGGNTSGAGRTGNQGLSGAAAGPEVQTAGSCRARHVGPGASDWEPDPQCTPGATRRASLSEICPIAHTRAVRPPVSYTGSLKRKQMAAYGFSDSPAAHQEDHLIPLELLGHPTDARNLWPQPSPVSPNDKDGLEDWLHDQVCENRLSLADAQHQIATDWYGTWLRAGRPQPRSLTGG